MKTNITRLAASMIVAAGLLSGVVYASASDNDSKEKKAFAEKRDGKRQQFYKDLNLTQEQKKALEENKNKNREQMKTLFAGMKEKKALIREELQKDELNMEKINQVQNELKALQTQMIDHRLEGILEVRKILTPEQFKKFLTKMEDQKGRDKHKKLSAN